MLLSCCPCISRVCDKDNDGIADVFERQYSSKKGDNVLDNSLKRNFNSIRGRKKHVRNIPITLLPTPFEDEPESEDEDGEAIPVVRDGRFAEQDYKKIRSGCLKNQQFFVDPMFPPTEESLFVTCSQCHHHKKRFKGIEWKRASEICDSPMFFVDGASRFDIKQGDLGDCWLLAAMANLTLHEKLFENVVPLYQNFNENYAGIFHFKIWQYGEWVDVVIDDYLPTRNGKLIYVKSATENEFWPALLEKAYAKLYGSYESIKSGSACEAMVDFSGGCSEIIHEIPHTQKEQDNLYNHMLKSFDRSSMITCYIYPDEKIVEARTQLGLIKGHAYSVTKVLKAKINKGRKKGLYPLVRVRNPWGGDVEWKGDWSDHSTSWKLVSDEDKNAIGLTFEHDGEFYMSQNDFMSHFDGIELTHLMPNSLSENEMKGGKIQWNEIHFNGTWIRGKNAGGCRNYIDTFAENPQYLVAIEDGDNDGVCTTVISLMQKGTRERKAGCLQDGSLPIGFIIYRLNPDDGNSSSYKYSAMDTTISTAGQLPLSTEFFGYNLASARSPNFINAREVSGRYRFDPGMYVIIPSTFEPNQEGDYLLRVLSERIVGSDQFR